MKMRGSASPSFLGSFDSLDHTFAQALAQFFGARRRFGESLRAAREDRGPLPAVRTGSFFAADASLRELRGRPAAIVTRGKNLQGAHKIHQMMRNPALFGRGNFGGADIEVTVDLRGIADQDFAAQAFRRAKSPARIFPKLSAPG